MAILAFVVAGILLLNHGFGGSTDRASGHFADAKLRYSFDYPREWSDVTTKVKLAAGKGTPNLVGRIALGRFDENAGLFSGVQVTVVQTTQQVSAESLDAALADLDDLFQKFTASVKGRENPPQSGELGGQLARQYVVQFVYQSGAQDEQVATAQTVSFLGDRQYTVNCQGRQESFDAEIRPGCEQALQSFRFN